MQIIITGGHSGIGLALSKKLLNEGHKIGLIVRTENRKKDALQEFDQGADVEIFVGDLSNRDKIVSVANEIKKSWTKIDGLFNNAGVLTDKLYMSDYGNEMQLEVNAISPFLLTQELKPLLEKAENPFVVNTATTNLEKRTSIDIAAYKKPKKFVRVFGSYMDSKLVMVTLMNHLAQKWQNIRIVNVHPGAINTKMTRGKGVPLLLRPLMKIMSKSPEFGANNLYKGAFDTTIKGTGIYVADGKVRSIQVEITDNQIKELTS